MAVQNLPFATIVFHAVIAELGGLGAGLCTCSCRVYTHTLLGLQLLGCIFKCLIFRALGNTG